VKRIAFPVAIAIALLVSATAAAIADFAFESWAFHTLAHLFK
jgi:hypothetical protein